MAGRSTQLNCLTALMRQRRIKALEQTKLVFQEARWNEPDIEEKKRYSKTIQEINQELKKYQGMNYKG